MDAIGDIIPRVIAPLAQGNLNPTGLAQMWERLYGKTEGAAAAEFKDGCLTVHVDCSARLVRMNAQKANYLAELSQKNPKIKALRFKVGKV